MQEVKPRRYRSPLREEQAAASRAAVLTAARELFLDQGYGATTIEQVAARAGVSKPTVFTAVGNEQRLLIAVRDVARAGAPSSTSPWATWCRTCCGRRSGTSSAPTWSPPARCRPTPVRRPPRSSSTRTPNGNPTINQVQSAVNEAFTKGVDDGAGRRAADQPAVRAEQGGPAAERAGRDQPGPGGVRRGQGVPGRAAAGADRRAANAARQSGYDSCPTCAQIDILKSLPSGLTAHAPGTGFSVTGQ